MAKNVRAEARASKRRRLAPRTRRSAKTLERSPAASIANAIVSVASLAGGAPFVETEPCFFAGLALMARVFALDPRDPFRAHAMRVLQGLSRTLHGFDADDERRLALAADVFNEDPKNSAERFAWILDGAELTLKELRAGSPGALAMEVGTNLLEHHADLLEGWLEAKGIEVAADALREELADAIKPAGKRAPREAANVSARIALRAGIVQRKPRESIAAAAARVALSVRTSTKRARA